MEMVTKQAKWSGTGQSRAHGKREYNNLVNQVNQALVSVIQFTYLHATSIILSLLFSLCFRHATTDLNQDPPWVFKSFPGSDHTCNNHLGNFTLSGVHRRFSHFILTINIPVRPCQQKLTEPKQE
ncbi:hypothetical protein ILYODFUR_015976 [Ilyodon furcidens]|uniref:Uncharacterized protein n=1 Tax=Ilyodon furcidens TaxID=33524 RepID=A0ABV0U5Q9_9TELE